MKLPHQACLAALVATLLLAGCRAEPASVVAVQGTTAAAPTESAATAETSAPADSAAPDSAAESEEPSPPAEAAPEPATVTAKPADDSNPAPGSTRPKADRTPRRPGEAEKITFDDLIIGLQANVVFRPWMMLDRPKELEGERVRIPGYMHPGAAATSGIKEFVLLRNKECKFGKDGQADHLTRVFLREGTKTNYIADCIVEGTLRIDPYTGADGNTWSIYTLDDAVMK